MSDRLLRVAVALLPVHRRDWGTAMRAELAAITDPAQRRSFSLGCLRAIAGSPRTTAGLLGRALVGVITVGTVVFTSRAAPAVMVESALWLSTLLALAVAGRRRSRLGPVAGTAVAAGWRLLAYLLLGGLALWLLRPRDGGPTHDPSGFWIAALLITLAFVAALRLTAYEPARTLLIAGLAAASSALIWCVLLLFLPAARSGPALSLLVIAGCAGVAGPFVERRRRGLVALITVFASGLLIFAVTGLTFFLSPSLAPYDAPPTGFGLGASSVTLMEQSRLEALDPFLLLLLLSAVTGPLCLVVSRISADNARRGDESRVLSPS